MSIPVSLEGLRTAVAERGGGAYLLTVADDVRPHAVHVALGWEGDRLVTEVGAASARNVAARPAVSLLYPAAEPGGYSLIVDGTAVVAPGEGKRRVSVAPTKAVLHRPAATPDPTAACADDCRHVFGVTRGRSMG
ncbi:MAG: pyridoxamine 5'-phosphate oxidase family protein [Deltaproteobacteria bacterium]|nr:pyridoxamine 5'-phosphate oxidase family protein [Deltaproteobacteria bacterium]